MSVIPRGWPLSRAAQGFIAVDQGVVKTVIKELMNDSAFRALVSTALLSTGAWWLWHRSP